MTWRMRGAPRLPEQEQQAAVRQTWAGGADGRVRNARPVRARSRGRRLVKSTAVDPCACCRCQRITTGTLEWMEEVGSGPYTLLTAQNCGCVHDGYNLVARPWLFINGVLTLNAWWAPADGEWPAEGSEDDYACHLMVDGLAGTGPWDWAWLWESAGGCWTSPS